MAGLTHIRGDSFSGECQRTIDGTTAFDLTGYSVVVAMRHPLGDSFEFTVTLTDPEDGRFAYTATPAQTRAWMPGLWRMEIEYTSPAGEVKTVGPCVLEVIQDIANAD